MSKPENPFMKKKKNNWRLLAKALGEKAGKNDEEADKIALIRLFMFISIFVTNCFIVYGVMRTHHYPAQVNQYKCNASPIKLGP